MAAYWAARWVSRKGLQMVDNSVRTSGELRGVLWEHQMAVKLVEQRERPKAGKRAALMGVQSVHLSVA